MHTAQGRSPSRNHTTALDLAGVLRQLSRIASWRNLYGETVFEDEAVRMWHTGDNIGILSFKTKMHTVSNEVLDGVLRAWRSQLQGADPVADRAASRRRHLLQLMQVHDAPAEGGMFDKLKGLPASDSPLRAAVASASSMPPPAMCRVEEVVAKFQQV
jgi:3-hydroxyacyl-CoA dehydrogenase